MADHGNDLFAIDVDADDYAENAAGDTPSVSRTYQSEADFQAVKAAYQAKVDGGNAYLDLIAAVPVLDHGRSDVDGNGANGVNGAGVSELTAKVRLGKRDLQLLSYAVGELYYDKLYARLLELCGRVRARCEIDGKIVESLERWGQRCKERLGR